MSLKVVRISNTFANKHSTTSHEDTSKRAKSTSVNKFQSMLDVQISNIATKH